MVSRRAPSNLTRQPQQQHTTVLVNLWEKSSCYSQKKLFPQTIVYISFLSKTWHTLLQIFKRFTVTTLLFLVAKTRAASVLRSALARGGNGEL
jgi:hypothetical protein